jgi:hypothetical protein
MAERLRLALGLALACAGCASPLDMTRAYHPERPALTVVYAGVREETRLYPDYNPIGASILTESGKKGK